MSQDVLFVLLITIGSVVNICSGAQDKDAKILILGAGMSGITAGKTLYDAGYTNFKILEASNVLGGRIRTETLGNTSVEMGAMWIYGKGSNPMYTHAVEFNLSLADSIADEWVVRDENGRDWTAEADDAYVLLEEALGKLSLFATTRRMTGDSDFTIRGGLRYFDWMPITPVEDAVEAYTVDFETGIQPSAHSGKYLYFDETFEEFGSYDILIVNDTRGHSYVVNQLAEPFVNQKVLYNTTVTDISYSDTGVTVYTTDGTIYTADYVIVTFSLGVLQTGLVTFTPPLPTRKQLAIDKHAIAEFTHIYLQYPQAFWDNTTYLLYAPTLRGKMSCWQNMNAISPGSNILQLSLFNEFARWADQATDGEILDEIQAALVAMYPNETIPAPSGYKISRWNRDPLFMGAFTYWPASFTSSDMDAVRAPVGRVYFAGEHTHPIHYGFSHGAYLTGVATAQDVMKCYEDSSYCAGSSSSSSSTVVTAYVGRFTELIMVVVTYLTTKSVF